MDERPELYYKLVRNALYVNSAGNPPAALVLLDEALRLDPGYALARSVKRQIESNLLKWMSEQHRRTVAKAVEEALSCERAGDRERAAQLARGAVALDPAQADAQQILQRLGIRTAA